MACRGDVWEAFQSRFAIPQILEFYAATEGNFSLYNAEGKPGAIGRIPGFPGAPLSHRHRASSTMRRARPRAGADGFCHRVARGEAGEAIGKIAGGAARFEGYTDAAATEKKILRDVFEPGDAWVRTGDLMRQDAQGFFYFVDRLGDTFRWKGENVATTEVAAARAAAPGVMAANVYGVARARPDGKAGMAALEADDGFDRRSFPRPSGAAPARLCAAAVPAPGGSLALTETFKQKSSCWRRRLRSLRASAIRCMPIAATAIVPLDADALCADQFGPDAPLNPPLRQLRAASRHSGFPRR